jgi:hypothetical protein
MQHPFIHNLEDKTIDELQKTISQLNSRLFQASRTLHPTLVPQIQMALESYNAEYTRRIDEVYKKQNLENKINITKS